MVREGTVAAVAAVAAAAVLVHHRHTEVRAVCHRVGGADAQKELLDSVQELFGVVGVRGQLLQTLHARCAARCGAVKEVAWRGWYQALVAATL